MTNPVPSSQARVRGIGARLGASFGAVVVITGVVAVATVTQLDRIETSERSLIENRLPALLDGEEMFVDLGQSFTQLRDYLLLGDPKHRDERRETWKLFEKARERLAARVSQITEHDFASDLARIDALSATLEQLQTKIEDVAVSKDNFPALQLYDVEAAPAADRMIAAITALIDEEKKAPADADRKALLANLADSRGSIATAIAALRAYVVSGEDGQRAAFDQRFAKNAEALDALTSQAHLLSATQRKHFDDYRSAREAFSATPSRLITIRSSDQWNVAHAMLRDQLSGPTRELRDAVLNVSHELQKVVQNEASSALSSVGTVTRFVEFGSLISAIIGIVIAVTMSKSIVGRTRRILDTASRVEAGDLTARVGIAGSDEIASIGHALDRTFTRLQDVVKRIRESCEQVGQASLELATVSDQVRADAQEVSKQAASASAGATQVSGSTQSVAAAVEQLSKSTQDITKNVTDVNSIAAHAGEVAADANSSIRRLDAVAQKIGSVSKLISSIAEQTNLLALNATIEAARAGDSGKGFAVVATEVKSLATATGDATGEIAAQIESVQTETATSVELLASVSEVIRRINEAQQSIASAIEEQNATTHEITRNVSAAASGTQEIERSAREVARSAESTLGAVETTHVASANLSKMAEELRSTVTGFRV